MLPRRTRPMWIARWRYTSGMAAYRIIAMIIIIIVTIIVFHKGAG
jgi:hypothetical protein